MSMMLVVILLGSFFVMGLGLLIAGLRGKRIDDHPWCRKCKFDLFGSPADAEACPECGADLTQPKAVRIGQRRKRRGVIASGVVLLLLVGGFIAVTAWTASSSFDWNTIKPVWWLAMDGESANQSSATAALQELLRRQSNKSLSQSQVNALVDRALAYQADTTKPWYSQWGDLLEAAQQTGNVPAAKWKQYLEQGAKGVWKLVLRPKVRRGDVIAYRIERRAARVGSNGRIWASAKSDKMRIVIAGIHRNSTMGFGGALSAHDGGWTGGSIGLDPEEWDQLSDGPQMIEVICTLELFEDSTKQNAPPLTQRAETLTDTVTIVDAQTPTASMQTDPVLRSAVEQALRVQFLEYGMQSNLQYMDAEFEIDKPPIGIAFDIILQADGQEWSIGSISQPKDGKTTYHTGREVEDFDVDKVDVILRPSLEAATRTVDVFEIWGEDVVYKDVPVTRKAGP